MNPLRVWVHDSNCNKLTDEDEYEDDSGHCRRAKEHVPEVGADGVQRRRVRHKRRRGQEADGNADLVTTETILMHACGQSLPAFPIQPQTMLISHQCIVALAGASIYCHPTVIPARTPRLLHNYVGTLDHPLAGAVSQHADTEVWGCVTTH